MLKIKNGQKMGISHMIVELLMLADGWRSW
jgi:hypothetical protein